MRAVIRGLGIHFTLSAIELPTQFWLYCNGVFSLFRRTFVVSELFFFVLTTTIFYVQKNRKDFYKNSFSGHENVNLMTIKPVFALPLLVSVAIDRFRSKTSTSRPQHRYWAVVSLEGAKCPSKSSDFRFGRHVVCKERGAKLFRIVLQKPDFYT